MEEIFNTQNIISLLTLTALEVVLGIDNVIFLSILAGKLPPHQQEQARKLGLSLALLFRLGLVAGISWVMGLTQPLFSVLEKEISGRDLILIIGGLFLIAKSTHEIHDKLEVKHTEHGAVAKGGQFASVLIQILALDLVFSLDSVITAVGMAQKIWVMVTAMIVAVAFMFFFSKGIASFVNKHPTMKILALSFLILIGVVLLVEGFGGHVGKGYIYFAMAFSLGVELLNMRIRRASTAPLTLHNRFEDQKPSQG